MITVSRYHDISCGHRVVGHEGKCKNLHGHNYRIHFTARGTMSGGKLDNLGRVVDFSVIKTQMCAWLEEHWDHKTILWNRDPWWRALQAAENGMPALEGINDGIIAIDYNPTAENMALFLLYNIAPRMMKGTYAQIIEVEIEETRKCSAKVSLRETDYVRD